ncbi:MAG: glutathione S-transferase family protein [Sphingomonas sp.]
MLLYDCPNPAPNPRRVRMFLAEKGLSLPTKVLALRNGEHKAPEFLAINPMGQIPALVLDDGAVITESIAICRYLEAEHPEPPLFGTDGRSMAQIDMMLRRVELRFVTPLAMIWMHTHPFTAQVVKPQYREFGESNRSRVASVLREFEAVLAAHPFLAGDDYSIADIALYSALEFATLVEVALSDDLPNLKAWHARCAARPSGAA